MYYSHFTTCCYFHFDRIDSGFNDVKDPDELFTFKKMVKHFKKVKVQCKDKETGQIKEVTTQHCLKLGQLFHLIFNCLYVRLQGYRNERPQHTIIMVQICDQSDQGTSSFSLKTAEHNSPESAKGRTLNALFLFFQTSIASVVQATTAGQPSVHASQYIC